MSVTRTIEISNYEKEQDEIEKVIFYANHKLLFFGLVFL